MLCALVKLRWQIQANREIVSVTKRSGKHLKKNFNRHIKVWCHHRDYYFFFNVSDQFYILQIFSFVVRSFRLTQALKNGPRRKQNKKYRLRVGYTLVICLLS